MDEKEAARTANAIVTCLLLERDFKTAGEILDELDGTDLHKVVFGIVGFAEGQCAFMARATGTPIEDVRRILLETVGANLA